MFNTMTFEDNTGNRPVKQLEFKWMLVLLSQTLDKFPDIWLLERSIGPLICEAHFQSHVGATLIIPELEMSRYQRDV